MDDSLVTLFDRAGSVLARGRLRKRDDGRTVLEVREGAARLRAAYFLDGVRSVVCEYGRGCYEARLRTCWERNRRLWFIEFRALNVPLPGRAPAAA
jgi:hypothetical protein